MADRSAAAWDGPGHAVRPRGAPFHAADIVRRARIHVRGRELVFRDRTSREHRYPAGEGGIERAVFVPPPDSGTAVRTAFADRWGVVDFRASDGRTVLRVPLAEWLPESGLVGLLDLSVEDCLERTGLRSLAEELGVSWGEEDDQLLGPRRPDTDSRKGPVRAVHRDVPAWHGWVRGAGVLLWFVFFLLLPMTGNGEKWTVLVATAGLFLLPAADILTRSLLWARNRNDASFRSAEVISPSPEPGAGATRRFTETASVRVLPGDVVLTNTVGEERRLARGAAHGVTRLVRLLDRRSGAVLGVEFRDRSGAARALLPWEWWFAGPSGPDGWSRLVAALGVPTADEEVTHPHGAGPWWSGHTLAADARKMSPIDAREARRETSWRSTVIGTGESIVIPILGLIPLAGIGSNQGAAQAAGVLAALTILAELVPVIGHQAVSRFKLDRPIEPESP